MKVYRAISFLLFLFPCISLMAQHEDDKRFSKRQYENFKIASPTEKITPGITITDLLVFDNRPDTTHIGLMYTSFHEVVLYRFRDNFRDEIKRFFELVLEKPASPTLQGALYCFIKKFSLSDMMTVPLDETGKKEAAGKFDNKEGSGVKVKIEFYLKRDDYFIPAWRFDSLWAGDKGVSREGGTYIAAALTASLRKAATLNWAKVISGGKKLSWDEITAFNNSEYNYPVLLAAPQKGVFANFEDFRTNKVSYTNFSITRDKKGDFLYIKNQAGEETLLTDLWGYSDGKDLYIYSANNFFKLYRSGNSFMFYGAKDYTKRRSMRMNFRLIDVASPNSAFSKQRTSAKYDLEKDYLQLDWYTGEIY